MVPVVVAVVNKKSPDKETLTGKYSDNVLYIDANEPKVASGELTKIALLNSEP